MTTFYAVDPNSTFLLTSQDSPTGPLIVDLSAYVGQTISINEVGGPICFSIAPGCPTREPNLGGIFSNSSVLLPDVFANPQRVPAAVSTGLPDIDGSVYDPNYVGMTFNGLANVNPFDFYVDDVTLVVPAPYLFVGVIDSHYGDNGPANGLGVDITTYGQEIPVVPEPSYAFLTLLLIFILGWKYVRKITL